MLLPLLLGLNLAHAQDCDAKALVKELTEASPVRTGVVYKKLVSCDEAIAKRAAKEAFAKMVANEEAYEAAAAAIKLGQGDLALAWIDGLQSDEKSKAIKELGKNCDSPEVPAFFIRLSSERGKDFWEDRWYTALADCRVDAVQDVLFAELNKGIGKDRGRFFGVLETYARSQGKNAVPKLKALAEQASSDSEAQVNIVSAFADAARVGSVDGMDAEAAGLATAAIVELAPTLQQKAVGQARITLTSLGAEAEADQLAGVYYKEVRQKSGDFLWGVVVSETGTCKNGKAFQRLHVAEVSEGGMTWPDQLKDKVEASVKVGWELDMAERCKGTGAVRVIVPEEPFADSAAFKAWSDEVVKNATSEEIKKPAVIVAEAVKL